MKVLIINGSPRINGNTSLAIKEMEKIFEAQGVDTETVQVGNMNVRGCIACRRCGELGKCVFDDIVNELAPKFREVILGRIEVRNVFKLSSSGMIAGSYVLDGKVTRNAQIRVVRDGIVIAEDAISSLKRFKDDVKEVAQGYECGIGLEKFNDLKEGDIFEAFVMEEYKD